MFASLGVADGLGSKNQTVDPNAVKMEGSCDGGTELYAADQGAKQAGHVLARRPPYHCNLNPTDCLAELPGFDSRRGQGVFLYFAASRLTLRPIQLPILWVPWALSPGVKRLGRGAVRSPPSSAEVKNGGANPPHPIRLHGVVMNELSSETT
jgi:hypothetical protein